MEELVTTVLTIYGAGEPTAPMPQASSDTNPEILSAGEQLGGKEKTEKERRSCHSAMVDFTGCTITVSCVFFCGSSRDNCYKYD
jgi:hypothetical protein